MAPADPPRNVLDIAMLQAELLERLGPSIGSGRVVVHDSDERWVELLRRMYPMRDSGVRWEDVPNASSYVAEDPRVPLDTKIDVLRMRLKFFGEAARIARTNKCIVLGDAVTDAAFEFDFECLLELFHYFFALPQSTYVFNSEATWCFVYTFEEDVYFGKSPFSSKTD